jgi:hypothetical protein
MADHYQQFSLAFPLRTNEEKEWCIRTMDRLATLVDSGLDGSPEARMKLVSELGDLGRRFLDEEWDFCDFEWSVEPVELDVGGCAAEMWIHADESGDPDQVAAFLQAYLQKFNPNDSLWFSWAYTCSKMRVNEFGGGAAVVTADAIKLIDAQRWALDQAMKPSELNG